MRVCSICQRAIIEPWWCPVHPFAKQTDLVPLITTPFTTVKRTYNSTVMTELRESLSLECRSSEEEYWFWHGVAALRQKIEETL